ncbi:haloacid dehalogenase-like hydrolase domain-containing protein 3 [Carcharodon carcharias]|uniref:haloacid dehalogenase-like hydrolase domain-containing protein 3 n=1 Tax=Carcharodon carcharias TaxID=13397 RepID=UPI001B7EFF16|nr:haloacid dehalogenase-like hydrolase domain-containing protein 3 [Carcharodon carcharias]XP_041050014.1 haloacid dehalogenase-like hydrolase domain-containing protein 3 [Carcharodon carcharias]XP_041050015.1 haloacid dehalogenase-like hydrolase domain-containing protein 3 [Carcharodon carcharias]XP_041050016.1 haloacid dehalogenase-like hydrolase domain-containing protein 3 [Carcharodon carcharias]XP_041050017.1 haloacid dehalogenase-like hydrolase domain-containing protein 3 [Carcharodon ca
MRPRLLTWDVKDTLLRVRHTVGEQYSLEAKLHGIRVEAEALNSSFLAAMQTQNKLFPNYGLGQGLSSQQWWMEIVKRTFRLCGVSDERVLSPMAENLYQGFSSARNWEVFNDVKDTLIHCDRLGICMGVISNFDRRLEKILANCSLRQHFQFVLTSEDVGIGKPDHRIFIKALGLAQVEPEQATHIGDDVWNDYLAARAVGMESYLICREKEQPARAEGLVPKDHILHSLQQLNSLLK